MQFDWHSTENTRIDRSAIGAPFSSQVHVSWVRRCHSEHYATCTTIQLDRFDSGSDMVWGGISVEGRTNLQVIVNGMQNFTKPQPPSKHICLELFSIFQTGPVKKTTPETKTQFQMKSSTKILNCKLIWKLICGTPFWPISRNVYKLGSM